MSTRTVTTADLPFPIEQVHTTDAAELEHNRAAAETLRAGATTGVLWSLGATNLGAVPGTHGLGGLLFIARILPLTANGRGEAARRMAVMVSVTPGDLLDIDVRQLTGDRREHATTRDLYLDQLQRALLALDYDGREPFNPRYWTN
ncbi:MAG: hypothetical protein JSS74_04215 [Actinobacteria bacterium]|nr:hypothetical protein [Actinomycetota bacterium]